MVMVDSDTCVGCGQCANSCPAQILGMNDKAAVTGDPSECLGCQTCVTVCPNGAIIVQEY